MLEVYKTPKMYFKPHESDSEWTPVASISHADIRIVEQSFGEMAEALNTLTSTTYTVSMHIADASSAFMDLVWGRIDMGRYEQSHFGKIYRKKGFKPLLHKGRKP